MEEIEGVREGNKSKAREGEMGEGGAGTTTTEGVTIACYSATVRSNSLLSSLHCGCKHSNKVIMPSETGFARWWYK